jgi:hypothetical protein
MLCVFIGFTRGLGACMIWHKHVYAERADKYAYVQFIVDAHVFFLILVYFCKIVA